MLGDVEADELVLGVVALALWSSARVGSVVAAVVLEVVVSVEDAVLELGDVDVEDVVLLGLVLESVESVVEVVELGVVDELLRLGLVDVEEVLLGLVLENVESLVEVLELGLVIELELVELGLVLVEP